MPSSISSIIRKPRRTSAWSSAISTQHQAPAGAVVAARGLQRQYRQQLEPALRTRPGAQRSAVDRTRSRMPSSPLPGLAVGAESTRTDRRREPPARSVRPVVDRHLDAPRVPRVPQGVVSPPGPAGTPSGPGPAPGRAPPRSPRARRPDPPCGTSPPTGPPGRAGVGSSWWRRPDCRSTPTIRRISARASRPTASTVSSACLSTACSA